MTDVQVEGESSAVFEPTITIAGMEFAIGDTMALSDEVMRGIVIAGLTAICEKANGAAKAKAGITKLEGKALEDRKAEVRKAVEKSIEQLKAGQLPGKAKTVKVSGAIMTEAMRLARNIAKDHVRNSGQRIGAYSAKEYTEAAKKIIADNPNLLKLAEQKIAERAGAAEGSKGINLEHLFGAEKANDPANKAKPKVPPKPKGKKEGQLSAKQAGLVASRQKPPVHTTQH